MMMVVRCRHCGWSSKQYRKKVLLAKNKMVLVDTYGLMNNAGGNGHDLDEIVGVFAKSVFKLNCYRGETFCSSGGV